MEQVEITFVGNKKVVLANLVTKNPQALTVFIPSIDLKMTLIWNAKDQTYRGNRAGMELISSGRVVK